ncbi:SGNH hydrolase domain-containing protein [Azotobacter chroococcum]
MASACEIARHRPLFLMRPIPEMVIDVPHAMAKTMLIGAQREVSITLADYHKRHAFVWSLQDEAREQCGARILDPLPYLCDGKVCHGSRNGIPLYADDDHLSEFGNRLLVPMFAKAFASMQDAGEALAHRREDATGKGTGVPSVSGVRGSFLLGAPLSLPPRCAAGPAWRGSARGRPTGPASRAN